MGYLSGLIAALAVGRVFLRAATAVRAASNQPGL